MSSADQTPHEAPAPAPGTASGTPQVEHPEVVRPGDKDGTGGDAPATEAVEHPAKVMRIGSMVKLLLEEVRQSDDTLDEPSRDRLREIYETSVSELASALSPDLQEELRRLAHPFAGQEAPSGAELRIAKAQLVGWLEGLSRHPGPLFASRCRRQQLEDTPAFPARRRPPRPTPRPPGTYL